MPKSIIAVIDDLFFASKVRGTAEQAGVPVSFARDAGAIIDAARRDPPVLIIVDLNSQKVDPIQLAKQLKGESELSSIPLLGFFAHVQTELQEAAIAAGFDRVLPRSAFTKNLPEILAGK